MQQSPNPNRHFCIIANPKAGKAYPLKILPLLKNELDAAEYTYSAFTDTLPHNLEAYTDLIVVGGDGTIHYVLNYFKDISIPIIILPAGTGNDFSWKLSGKKHAMDIFKQAINRPPVAVDAGSCNGRIFLNGVGIGFDGEVAQRVGVKKAFGFLSYLFQVLRTIFTYREQQMQVCCHEVKRNQAYFMVSVANGSRYGGGFVVAPRADISDGLLDLALIRPLPVVKRLRYLPLMKKGDHLLLPFVEYIHTSGVIITCQNSMPAHLDGEVITDSRFEISVLKGKYLLR